MEPWRSGDKEKEATSQSILHTVLLHWLDKSQTIPRLMFVIQLFMTAI